MTCCCFLHVQLDDVWQAAASALRSRLLKALGPEACSELHIIGRSRKQKVMLDAEHVTERMEVAGRTYEYMQVILRALLKRSLLSLKPSGLYLDVWLAS